MSKGKKSITASFGLLAAGLDDPNSPSQGEHQVVPLPSPSLPRVGAGVIGAAQRSIGELRDERDRLKALVESGAGGSVELDPALVDPSPFPDRLPDDQAGDFESFRKAMETEGQKIPIQVRPHPDLAGRYQVIYGHRRLKAAKELGVSVKALVVDMNDHDLVVSQGIENAARQDLTWIERALFARRMDEANIRPRDIKAALCIDDAELARMRGVYRGLPLGVIEAIGRAPKVGRPRWGEFAKFFTSRADGEDVVRKTLSADKVSRQSSDERFRLVLTALKGSRPEIKAGIFDVRDPDGQELATLKVSPKELRIVASNERGRAFSAFLQAEMPELVEKFLQQATE